MGPRCKIFKYKKRRSSSKPVVQTEKPVKRKDRCPPKSKSISTIYYDNDDEGYLEGFSDDEIPYFQESAFEEPKDPLQLLREWLERQTYIPHDLSNGFLMLFLSAAGYDVGIAKEKLQTYFYSRQEPSPLFRDRDPLSPANVKIFNNLYVLPVPDTTDKGRKIILTGLMQSAKSYNQMDHVKALALVLDLLIWEQDLGFGDFEVVLDGRGFECPHLLQNQVANHRSITSLLLGTIPGTLRSFYLLYPPPHVANVADNRNGIWLTVVKSKMEMKKYIPPDSLPMEFGGNLGHLDDCIEQWMVHLAQSRDFLINFEKRMIHDYQMRMCNEKARAERGKNWVSQMKLVADEWEYKIQYYERMKNMKPAKHPAFGIERLVNMKKEKPPKDPFEEFRKVAKEQIEASRMFEITHLYHGYAKEIRAKKLAEEKETKEKSSACCPIFELGICYVNGNS